MLDRNEHEPHDPSAPSRLVRRSGRAFETASRTLKFHLAAEEPHLTQAAVRRQSKALENAVGARLLKRDACGMRGTLAGITLLRALGPWPGRIDVAVGQRRQAEGRTVAAALVQRLGEPCSVDGLHRFPCAVRAADPSARGIWRLGERDVEPAPRLPTNDYQHLREQARSGEAITELPPVLANRDIDNGRLRPLLRAHPLREHEINLLNPSHRHPSSIVRAYLDFCQQHAPDLLRPLETRTVARHRP